MTINKTGEWVAVIGGIIAAVGVAATVVVWLLSVSIKEQTKVEVQNQLLNLDDPEQSPAFVTMRADVSNLQEGQKAVIASQQRLEATNTLIYEKLLEIAERNAK
jgi:hypothetical protein